MSCVSGPSEVTANLVFYYDMGNTQKSWKGMPTINTYAGLTAFNGLTGTYQGVNSSGWSVYALSGTWNSGTYPYSMAITSNANFLGAIPYSAQMDIYTSCPQKFGAWGAINYVNDVNMVNNGTQTIINNNYYQTWKREGFIYSSGFAGAGGTSQFGYLVTMPISNGTTFNPSTDFVYVRNVQIEQNPFCTPITNGTRTSTQSIIDLTNKNTANAVSLTYNNDGTFSFNGANNVITVNGMPYQFLTTGVTISLVLKYNQTRINDNVISWGNSAFNGGLSYSWEVRFNAGTVEFSPGVYTSGTAPARMAYAPSPVLNGRTVIMDVVYNANNVSYIYENGVQVATYDYTGVGLYTNTQNIRIGQGTDTYFPGNIYAVKLYNRALSPNEVQQNFNALRGRFGL